MLSADQTFIFFLNKYFYILLIRILNTKEE